MSERTYYKEDKAKDLRIAELESERDKGIACIQDLQKDLAELKEKNKPFGWFRTADGIRVEIGDMQAARICMTMLDEWVRDERNKNTELLAVLANKNEALDCSAYALTHSESNQEFAICAVRDARSIPVDMTALNEIKAGYEAVIEKMKERIKSCGDLICKMCIRLNPQHTGCTGCEDMDERRQNLLEIKVDRTALDELLKREREKSNEYVRLYNQLLLAVARKFPDETRHQTALRYIREAENNHGDGSCQRENREKEEGK